MAKHYNIGLALVKSVSNIDDTNSDFDDDLRRSLNQAYSRINIQLEPYTTVPLAAPDNMIIQIEADIGAGLFKEERVIPAEGERTRTHILRERGEQALADYIKTKYLPSGDRRSNFFKHVKDDRKMQIDGTDEDV